MNLSNSIGAREARVRRRLTKRGLRLEKKRPSRLYRHPDPYCVYDPTEFVWVASSASLVEVEALAFSQQHH